MNNNRNLSSICGLFGIILLLIYLILTLVGGNNYLYIARVVVASLAAIVYAIRMYVSIKSSRRTDAIVSAFILAICLFDVLISALLIK